MRKFTRRYAGAGGRHQWYKVKANNEFQIAFNYVYGKFRAGFNALYKTRDLRTAIVVAVQGHINPQGLMIKITSSEISKKKESRLLSCK